MQYTGIIFIACLIFFSCTSQPRDVALSELDHALDESERFIVQKEHKISEIKESFEKATNDRERYDACMELYQNYQYYSLDSAFIYLDKAESFAKNLDDERITTDNLISKAFLYNFAGMSAKSLDIFKGINPNTLPKELHSPYYYLGFNIYNTLSQSSISQKIQEEYLQQRNIYRDSALVYSKEDIVLMAERMADSGESSQAITLLAKNLPDGLRTNEAGLRYFVLSEIYERLGDKEKQIHYLAMSSTASVENSVKQYIALRKLAMLMYDKGDYKRAYRYVHVCMDDAMACNSQLRLMETSAIIPIIDSAVMKQKQYSRIWLFSALFLISLLGAILLFMLVRRRRLYEKLNEADKVKDEYLNRFMNLCLEYIGKMENYRKRLSKVAQKRNFDELYETIQSSRYINKEVADFYNNFDEAFLRIYPDFIVQVNRLLKPDAQIALKPGERLSTELRIFALMKLGITDGAKVQEFLRCSASTVYNYRTTMRNRAINRDTFEADIAQIK